ncbi:DNA-binding protein [Lactococcus cremoris]|uniref:DNA-binding protein n=1 Tax=Lactococcus lactis subsp. cremoris TaxID=1359 RepID=A0AA34TL53_LACLC|nr:hypothetical protein [Lactococcus cremoris]ARE24330.1 DNA-binding protein [Lactococcus cremoris]KZK50104.1 hypothetical protein SK110_0241 [Lactococcus cremoris]MCT4420807.1 DNA-binding protein [Lactococcus cremoris]MCT4423086.1 DNA-binding protein [Lactococcus cremoris]MCT4425277.1 DNA-binding protein [Lactococcus cremoris]
MNQTNENQYPYLLTRELASKYLGIDPKSFDKYIRVHSDFKRFMIGNQERYTLEEINFFIKNHLVG